MAVYEHAGLLKYKDEAGNIYILRPITDSDNVSGLGDLIAGAQVLDKPVAATSNDGITYNATVDGIDSLYIGLSFIMVPDHVSASTTAKLNVNNLGAKTLRLRGTGYTATTIAPTAANWMALSRPVRVTYNGMYWVADIVADAVSDFTYGTADLTAGTSTLATGKLYFVYE